MSDFTLAVKRYLIRQSNLSSPSASRAWITVKTKSQLVSEVAALALAKIDLLADESCCNDVTLLKFDSAAVPNATYLVEFEVKI